MTGQTPGWPRGLMDMASDFGSEDCGFESHRGQFSFAVQLGLGIMGQKIAGQMSLIG